MDTVSVYDHKTKRTYTVSERAYNHHMKQARTDDGNGKAIARYQLVEGDETPVPTVIQKLKKNAAAVKPADTAAMVAERINAVKKIQSVHELESKKETEKDLNVLSAIDERLKELEEEARVANNTETIQMIQMATTEEEVDELMEGNTSEEVKTAAENRKIAIQSTEQ